MPVVNVPNVGRVRFPDTMSEEEIQRAIETELMQKKPAAQAPTPVAAVPQPSAPAREDPAAVRARYLESLNPAEKFLAGIGKSVFDTGRGLRQVATEIGQAGGIVKPGTAEALRAQYAETRRADAPLMRSGYGMAGNIAGHIAQVAIPASVAGKALSAAGMARTGAAVSGFAAPTTYGGAALAGGIQGAIQPVTQDESRLMNTAVGGAFGVAGQALSRGISKIAQPTKNALSQGERQSVRTLEDAGVELDAAQKTGSKALERVRASLEDQPVTASAMREHYAKQQTQFNRAAIKLMGEDADAATPDVMARASERIGSYYDAVAARNTIKIDTQLGDDVQGIMRNSKDTLLPDEYAMLSNLMDDVQTKGTRGELSFDQWQRIKQALDDISKRGGKLGYNARDLRGAFNAALSRSATGNDAQLLADANRQWAVMKKLEEAVARNPSGDISPARLFNVLGKKDARFMSIYGKGNQELTRLARAGKTVLGSKTPNSGTPARMLAQAAIPAALGGGYALATGDYESAAKLAALGIAAPYAAKIIMTNPRAAQYMAEGMSPGVTRNALTSQTANVLSHQLPYRAFTADVQGQ